MNLNIRCIRMFHYLTNKYKSGKKVQDFAQPHAFKFYHGICSSLKIRNLRESIKIFIIPQKSFSFIKLLRINELFITFPGKMNY